MVFITYTVCHSKDLPVSSTVKIAPALDCSNSADVHIVIITTFTEQWTPTVEMTGHAPGSGQHSSVDGRHNVLQACLKLGSPGHIVALQLPGPMHAERVERL